MRGIAQQYLRSGGRILGLPRLHVLRHTHAMDSLEEPKIEWQDVYPSLNREELREAQTHFLRYVEIALDIAGSTQAVDHAIDTVHPIFIIKERSNRNKN